MSDVSSERISVSREALRAELAEMELRMRLWMAAELQEKASAADLAALRGEFQAKAAWAESMMPLRDQYIAQLLKVVEWRDQAQSGSFTPAQQAAMQATARNVLTAATSEGWTRRERLFATVAIVATIAVSVLNVFEATGVI